MSPDINLDALFQTRRSIRKYKPDAVPREKIDRILNAGRWAPSGANRQPWLFVVVENPEAKAEIRKHAERADSKWHARAPEWMKEFFDRYEITSQKDFLTDVPYLICVFGERGNPYWRESVWIAVGYMVLAARAEGLGSLTYTPGQTMYLNKILNVDDQYRPVAVLPIGVPDEEPDVEERPRKPVDERVRFAKDFVRVSDDTREPLHELSGVKEKLTASYVPALGDTRLAFVTIMEIASILQEGRSAASLLPRLSRALTRLVPAKSIEIALMGSALRCEVPTGKVRESEKRRHPTKARIEEGKAVVPLSVGDQIFGALYLERDKEFSGLELETLVDAGRIISLGLWSRFVQIPKA